MTASNRFLFSLFPLRFGIPDSNIVLMIADCSTCDARNSFPGRLVGDIGPDAISWHPVDAAIDYKGRDVSVENVIRVLTGRHPPGTPPSRQLRSHANASVLLYLTGHGGDGFLKFHDQEELLASDLGRAVADMYERQRYGELLIMLDTCQAATIYGDIDVPGWIGVSSSVLGQSSYALHSDPHLGAHLVDEFTYHMVRYLDSVSFESLCWNNRTGDETRRHRPLRLEDLVDHIRKQKRMSSAVDVDVSKLKRAYADVPVSDFFAACDGSSNRKEFVKVLSTSGGSGVVHGAEEDGSKRGELLDGDRSASSRPASFMISPMDAENSARELARAFLYQQ